jgi:hypothetical protein
MEGEYGANTVHTFVNGKIVSVETITGTRGGKLRRIVEGVNSSMIYLIYCKNFGQCHNVPPTQHNN